MCKLSWLAPPALVALIAATRWPLAPTYLFYFDSVNFALALEEFNPALHQPQPPGYPVFVFFARLLHLVAPRPEHVFLLAGIVGTAAACLCLYRLAGRMFHPLAGLAAAALLAVHPVLWFGSLTNQVRVFAAVIGCGTAVLVWRAWQPGSPARWLYGAALFLGIASGFRPPALLFLTPLLAAAVVRRRGGWREAGITALLAAAGTAMWLPATILRVGGLEAYATLLAQYAREQFSGSSLLYGAPARAAWEMVEAAAVWNGMGVLAWIWILPAVDWSRAKETLRPAAWFLALWFLPAFAFHSLVHVADPDQTSLTIPVSCLLGGFLLSQARWPAKLTVPAAAAVTASLFFLPSQGPARTTTYRVVRYVERQTTSTFDTLHALERQGVRDVISYDSFITWRHLSYYFPGMRILVLEQGPRVWQAGREAPAVEPRDGAYQLSAAPSVAILPPPPGRGVRERLRRQPIQLHEYGSVIAVDAQPGQTFTLRGARFRFAAAKG